MLQGRRVELLFLSPKFLHDSHYRFPLDVGDGSTKLTTGKTPTSAKLLLRKSSPPLEGVGGWCANHSFYHHFSKSFQSWKPCRQ